MKLRFDRQADALYMSLSDSVSTRTDEVAPGIVIDYDELDQIVGIELLSVSKRAPDFDLQRVVLETVPNTFKS